MRQLFSDSEFNEKLNKKYEIMAQKANQPASGIDYGDPEQRQFLKDEAHWADIRKRNAVMDAKKYDDWKKRMDLSRYGADDPLVREGMPNASKLDQIREENAGELARKQLGLEFDKRKLDVENIRDYYKTDVSAKSAKYTGSAELIKAASARANDTTLLPEQRQEAIDFLNNQYAMANKEARQGLTEEAPAAIPAAVTPGGNAAPVSGFPGKNPPTDFSDSYTPGKAAANPAFSLDDLVEPVGDMLMRRAYKTQDGTPTAPQNTTPSTPATGLGGSIGRGWYGFTHPDEPIPMTRAESPLRKASDKFVFDTAPKAVANTAIGAVRGVQDFGSNTVLGYEQRKAEEEAKKKRKALY